MKITAIALFVALFGAALLAQEPVNRAVSQPSASQPSASQPGVSQPGVSQPVVGSLLPVSIPTVFVPLPTQHQVTQPGLNATPHVASAPRMPAQPETTQPKACGCSK